MPWEHQSTLGLSIPQLHNLAARFSLAVTSEACICCHVRSAIDNTLLRNSTALVPILPSREGVVILVPRRIGAAHAAVAVPPQFLALRYVRVEMLAASRQHKGKVSDKRN